MGRDIFVETKLVRVLPGEQVFVFDGQYDRVARVRRIFIPNAAGASCFVINWASTNSLFTELTSENTPTGRYFELDVSQLDGSQTGGIIGTVELPVSPDYAWRYAIKMNTSGFGGGNAGKIVHYNSQAGGIPSQNFVIEDTSVLFPDYPERIITFGDQDILGANDTATLELRYEVGDYDLTSPGSGYVRIEAIRVCKYPKQSPIRDANRMQASVPSGSATDSRTVTLINELTGEAEYYAIFVSENGNTSSGTTRVKVNGSTVLEYSIGNDQFLIPLPENLAGTSVTIDLEVDFPSPGFGEAREARLVLVPY